jgi:hypothetical protein
MDKVLSMDVDDAAMILVPAVRYTQTVHTGIEAIGQQSLRNRIHAPREAEWRLFVPWTSVHGRSSYHLSRSTMRLLARYVPAGLLGSRKSVQLAYCVSTNLGTSDESTSSLCNLGR